MTYIEITLKDRHTYKMTVDHARELYLRLQPVFQPVFGLQDVPPTRFPTLEEYRSVIPIQKDCIEPSIAELNERMLARVRDGE